MAPAAIGSSTSSVCKAAGILSSLSCLWSSPIFSIAYYTMMNPYSSAHRFPNIPQSGFSTIIAIAAVVVNAMPDSTLLSVLAPTLKHDLEPQVVREVHIPRFSE